MPGKYQPDYPYLRRVPLRRVHLFTFIQIICLLGLVAISEIPQSIVNMILPIALVVVVGIRYLLWKLKIFNEEELKHLDDVLPDFTRHAHLDDEDKAICIDSNNKDAKNTLRDSKTSFNRSNKNGSCSSIQRRNCDAKKVPLHDDLENDRPKSNVENRVVDKRTQASDDINITEEVNHCSIWTSLVGQPASTISNKKCMKKKKVSSNKSRTKWQGVQTIAQDSLDKEIDSAEHDEGITFKGLA